MNITSDSSWMADPPKHDLNAQNSIDMTNARKAATVSVEKLQDFLYSESLNIRVKHSLPSFLDHRRTRKVGEEKEDRQNPRERPCF